MRLRILDVNDVAQKQLCCGCGACAYADPEHVRMTDTLEHGRRPIASAGAKADGLAVCPGVSLAHSFDAGSPMYLGDLAPAWGPVLDVWEGFAGDSDIRFAGSSGGAASALALYCVERAGMHGVLHVAARADVPYLNHTVLSTSREEVLAATGSRYAPASPCDGLQRVENAPAACVFIGKPCDVAATAKARSIRPALDEKLGLTIAVFCAGTPSTRGTLEMFAAMGIDDPTLVAEVRYRGMGWPGHFRVTLRDGRTLERTYQQSWGEILQKHRPWRCYTCVDHTGEFADISVGDPWHRPIAPGDPGRSLILVRTERGRSILRDAIHAGYIRAAKAEPSVVEASQKGFPSVRGSVWGRIFTTRLMGAAAPTYRRMPMFRFWLLRLTLRQKAQSIFGTVKRVFRRGLRGRIEIVPFEPHRGAERTEKREELLEVGGR